MIGHAFVRRAGQAGAPVPLARNDVASLGLSEIDFLWLHLVQPNEADLRLLAHAFQVHTLTIEDIARRHQRPKIDEYGGYYFLVLYALEATQGLSPPVREVQVLWGHHFLVTITDSSVHELDDLAARIGRGELRPMDDPQRGAEGLCVADLAYRLLDGIVDTYFPFVDALAEHSEDVEEAMFLPGQNRQTLEQIFALKKTLITVRKVIAPSRDVLNVLLRHDVGLFGGEYVPYFQDVYDHTARVLDSLDIYRDLLSSAIDIYLSIVSNNVNQTVKTMTAVTAILMVMALVPSVYGMNFRMMPELDWQFGYAWALGLMAAAAASLFMLFRRLRWM